MQLRTGRSRCRRSNSGRKSLSSSSDSSPAQEESEIFSFGPIGTEDNVGANAANISTFHLGGGYGTSSGSSVKESEDIDGDSSCERMVSYKPRKKSMRRHIALSTDSGISSHRTLSQRSWRANNRVSSPSEVISNEDLHNPTHPYSQSNGDFTSEIFPSASSSTSSSSFLSFTSSGAASPTLRRTKHRAQESPQSRRRRWLKTADVLRKSGLLDITIKTAELMRKNQQLQKDIENLQKETNKFVVSVLSNPENRQILENIQSQAQLYEVVVPGSQRLMMKPTESNLSFPFTFQIAKNPEERTVSADIISTSESQQIRHH